MNKRPPSEAIDIFLRHVKKGEGDACWLWTASLSCGYGQFWTGSKADGTRRRLRASRFSYSHFVGPIPEGAFVIHLCDVPSCVRPDHLAIGNQQENLTGMAQRWRGRPSKLGLPFGVTCDRRKRLNPFRACVTFRGKQYISGYFPTEELASASAVALKERLYLEEAGRSICGGESVGVVEAEGVA